MSDILDGKIAFVTAAGDGIGRAIAIAFAQNGANVIATSRTAAKMADLAEHGVSEIHSLDVTDFDAVSRAAEHLSGVDILVNCVGIVQTNTILSCEPEAMNETINVNLTGTINAIRAFLPGMLERGGGSIINIGSIISSLKGAPNRFAYGTSKGAINGLTKSVSNDFASQGIRCNAICPGTIETASMTDRINSADDPRQMRETLQERHPVGRLGRPEDVAAMAVHLASDASSFLTGQEIVIDGGWTA